MTDREEQFAAAVENLLPLAVEKDDGSPQAASVLGLLYLARFEMRPQGSVDADLAMAASPSQRSTRSIRRPSPTISESAIRRPTILRWTVRRSPGSERSSATAC